MEQHQSHLDFTKDEFLRPALEALLYIYGQPVSYKKLEEVLRVDRERIASAIENIKEEMRSRSGGLRVITDGNSAQLVTAPEYSTVVHSVVKEEFSESLTTAAIEALSIIAYRGPLSRAEIDYIRGVNSSYILRNLLMRGLIERHQAPERTRSYVYRASFDFLRALGIEKIEDLPEYEKYHDLTFSADGDGDEARGDESSEGDDDVMRVRNFSGELTEEDSVDVQGDIIEEINQDED